MTDFEDELRSALRREEPPSGFAARVMTRTGAQAPRRKGWLAAAIAACLLLSMGGFEYRQYQGRKAKQELLLALEIASGKLNMAQKKVNDLGRRTIYE
jgi:uncharacterized protein HemX